MAKTTEHYVFNSEADAAAALAEINADPIFPITGHNAKTGELEPSKQKTERWDTAPRACVGGKFAVPRLSQHWRDAQPAEKVNGFKARHPHSVEVPELVMPEDPELIGG